MFVNSLQKLVTIMYTPFSVRYVFPFFYNLGLDGVWVYVCTVCDIVQRLDGLTWDYDNRVIAQEWAAAGAVHEVVEHTLVLTEPIHRQRLFPEKQQNDSHQFMTSTVHRVHDVNHTDFMTSTVLWFHDVNRTLISWRQPYWFHDVNHLIYYNISDAWRHKYLLHLTQKLW